MLKWVRRIGCLLPLLTVLGVLAGLLVAGDVAARRYATNQLSDRISAAVPEASGVHARIRSFPFLGRLAFNGGVSEVGVHVDRLAGVKGVAFTDLDIDLRGVVVDTGVLVHQRKVRLKSIQQGTVSVGVTQEALSGALGRPVTLAGGVATVTLVGNRTVPATVSSAGGNLVVRAGALPPVVAVFPNTKLLPCLPTVTIGDGALHLSCSFTRIPDAFVQAAAQASG